jgi:hypothetical protein
MHIVISSNRATQLFNSDLMTKSLSSSASAYKVIL